MILKTIRYLITSPDCVEKRSLRFGNGLCKDSLLRLNKIFSLFDVKIEEIGDLEKDLPVFIRIGVKFQNKETPGDEITDILRSSILKIQDCKIFLQWADKYDVVTRILGIYANGDNFRRNERIVYTALLQVYYQLKLLGINFMKNETSLVDQLIFQIKFVVDFLKYKIIPEDDNCIINLLESLQEIIKKNYFRLEIAQEIEINIIKCELMHSTNNAIIFLLRNFPEYQQSELITPAIKEDLVVSDRITPTIKEDLVIIDMIHPVIKDDQGFSDRTTPAIKEDLVISDGITPVIREDLVIIDRITPVIQEDQGISDEATQVIKEIQAISDRITPVIKEDLESFDEISPSIKEDLVIIDRILQNKEVSRIVIDLQPFFMCVHDIFIDSTNQEMKIQFFDGSFEFLNSKVDCIVKKYSSASKPAVDAYGGRERDIYEEIHQFKVVDWAIAYYFAIEKLENNEFQLYLFLEKYEVTLETYDNKIIARFSETELKESIKNLLIGFLILKQKGIYHSILKPANIFIKNKQLKIGDSNISSLNSTSSPLDVLITSLNNQFEEGTKRYLSPEQYFIKKHKLENVKIKIYRANVFSLGVSLLEVVGNVRPEKYIYQELLKNRSKFASAYEEVLIGRQSETTEMIFAAAAEKNESRLFTLIENCSMHTWMKILLVRMLKIDFRTRAKFKELVKLLN